ncbi:MAG: hypothetical protein ACE5HS_16425 [bacterium]
MSSLKKSEKRLIALTVLSVVCFVFNQFVCQKADRPEKKRLQKTATVATAPSKPPLPQKPVQIQKATKKIKKLVKYMNWGRDPFAQTFRLSQLDTSRMDSTDFVLKGIIWQGKQAYVLIGDVILKSGEQKGDLKVLDIEHDRVICKKGRKVVTLLLNNDVL